MNSEDKMAYAPMYFPGTDNPAQAQRLTLAAGQEVSDLVMALRPMRATRVTGTAMTSDGQPMTGQVMVMTTSGGFGFSMTGGGQIRPDGTFTVNGLAPGEYTLRAQSFGPGGPAEAEMAIAKITATGDDITDLQLVGAKPSVGDRAHRHRSRDGRVAAAGADAHADAGRARRRCRWASRPRAWPTTERSS